MQALTKRAEHIEDLLIEHTKIKVDGKLMCHCGYVHKPGESIPAHVAAIIDAALTAAP